MRQRSNGYDLFWSNTLWLNEISLSCPKYQKEKKIAVSPSLIYSAYILLLMYLDLMSFPKKAEQYSRRYTEEFKRVEGLTERGRLAPTDVSEHTSTLQRSLTTDRQSHRSHPVNPNILKDSEITHLQDNYAISISGMDLQLIPLKVCSSPARSRFWPWLNHGHTYLLISVWRPNILLKWVGVVHLHIFIAVNARPNMLLNLTILGSIHI